MQVGDTGDGHDGAHGSRGYRDFVQSIELIELADLYLLDLVRLVMVDDDHLLIDADITVVHLAHADASHVFIVVNGADEPLSGRLRVSLRGRDIVQDRVEQRRHVFCFLLKIQGGIAAFGGGKDEGAVQLFVGGFQVHEQLQYLVDDLRRACFRPVDLIDADDDRKLQLQRFFQHEFCLRHGALKGVHHQDDAVYHLQHPLHFAAEIRMSRGIHDIDFHIFIEDGGIFGQDRDPALPLDIVGVHDPFRHLLIGTEDAALLQELVHQCCLSMIHMGNDRYVPYIFTLHKINPHLYLYLNYLCILYKSNSVSHFPGKTSVIRKKSRAAGHEFVKNGINFAKTGIFQRGAEYILQTKYEKRHFVKQKGEQNYVR